MSGGVLALDRGAGPVALMLADPTLYEELKLRLGGAGRSPVVHNPIDTVTSDES